MVPAWKGVALIRYEQRRQSAWLSFLVARPVSPGCACAQEAFPHRSQRASERASGMPGTTLAAEGPKLGLRQGSSIEALAGWPVPGAGLGCCNWACCGLEGHMESAATLWAYVGHGFQGAFEQVSRINPIVSSNVFSRSYSVRLPEIPRVSPPRHLRGQNEWKMRVYVCRCQGCSSHLGLLACQEW